MGLFQPSPIFLSFFNTSSPQPLTPLHPLPRSSVKALGVKWLAWQNVESSSLNSTIKLSCWSQLPGMKGWQWVTGCSNSIWTELFPGSLIWIHSLLFEPEAQCCEEWLNESRDAEVLSEMRWEKIKIPKYGAEVASHTGLVSAPPGRNCHVWVCFSNVWISNHTWDQLSQTLLHMGHRGSH